MNKIPDPCKACGALMGWVYSVRKPKNYPNVPVNWETLNLQEQTALLAGERISFNAGHVSHFSTCPKASQFSKSKPAETHCKPTNS